MFNSFSSDKSRRVIVPESVGILLIPILKEYSEVFKISIWVYNEPLLILIPFPMLRYGKFLSDWMLQSFWNSPSASKVINRFDLLIAFSTGSITSSNSSSGITANKLIALNPFRFSTIILLSPALKENSPISIHWKKVLLLFWVSIIIFSSPISIETFPPLADLSNLT